VYCSLPASVPYPMRSCLSYVRQQTVRPTHGVSNALYVKPRQSATHSPSQPNVAHGLVISRMGEVGGGGQVCGAIVLPIGLG